MPAPQAPRVYPWTVLGFAAGVVTAAAIVVAAWARADEAEVTAASVATVTAVTILFGLIIGLAVGQFIRIAGIARAWRPSMPTVLDVPAPSSNGHGDADGESAGPVTNGALFGVLATLGAVLAGPAFVPLLPAPIVLGVGALALDERVWVRVAASAGVFIAILSLAGFLVTSTLEGSGAGPVFLALIVVIGVGEFFLVRRVRPTR